jgi:hypothetical protein
VPVLCDDRCDQAVWKHRTALNHAPSALVFACKKTKQDTTQPRPRPYPSNVYAPVYGATLAGGRSLKAYLAITFRQFFWVT